MVTIYGSAMSNHQKTTVYLDAVSYRELQRLARAQGRGAATLVREAVLEYVAARRAAGRPRSIGAFGSGKGDLSERAEELLAGMGRDE